MEDPRKVIKKYKYLRYFSKLVTKLNIINIH